MTPASSVFRQPSPLSHLYSSCITHIQVKVSSARLLPMIPAVLYKLVHLLQTLPNHFHTRPCGMEGGGGQQESDYLVIYLHRGERVYLTIKPSTHPEPNQAIIVCLTHNAHLLSLPLIRLWSNVKFRISRGGPQHMHPLVRVTPGQHVWYFHAHY